MLCLLIIFDQTYSVFAINFVVKKISYIEFPIFRAFFFSNLVRLLPLVLVVQVRAMNLQFIKHCFIPAASLPAVYFNYLANLLSSLLLLILGLVR